MTSKIIYDKDELWYEVKPHLQVVNLDVPVGDLVVMELFYMN